MVRVNACRIPRRLLLAGSGFQGDYCLLDQNGNFGSSPGQEQSAPPERKAHSTRAVGASCAVRHRAFTDGFAKRQPGLPSTRFAELYKVHTYASADASLGRRILQAAVSREMNLVEILSFMFQLSFSTLGKDYSVEGMSDSLLTFLQHLREFGLVFQRKRKSRRYYPTRLAINLASGISGTSLDSNKQGFIVVETNYRIHAYTDSELQIALIALFSEMLYRFPNLVVAQVTRESVQQAIGNGITAEQVRG
ncbi:unnamed protein product [Ranitomeya imitator]|uniref:General transcription factor IIH subunit 4 n=1 Tax=Ranitomeya imitator TaxID=111125 RepID=A0ABN9LA46_9NEOB|nr:unnamed protein product [Ranitomeya imitator]